MADTKSLRTRIKSVDSTLHLTKAMGLVASSKIRRASAAMAHGRDYADALGSAIRMLAASPECGKSPYMAVREGERIRLIVVAGDRGLAGGYNANVFRQYRDFLAEHPAAQITPIPIGKRACDRFSGSDDKFLSAERFSCDEVDGLAARLCADFAAGEYDRLCILCTRYVSLMTQTAEVRDILPLKKEDGASHGMLFEPDEMTVLQNAVPLYVAGVIASAVRESFACEVAARRMAMDSAGKNAQMMIDDLQLAYNRARQGAITQEITEIVAGASAGSN